MQKRKKPAESNPSSILQKSIMDFYIQFYLTLTSAKFSSPFLLAIISGCSMVKHINPPCINPSNTHSTPWSQSQSQQCETRLWRSRTGRRHGGEPGGVEMPTAAVAASGTVFGAVRHE